MSRRHGRQYRTAAKRLEPFFQPRCRVARSRSNPEHNVTAHVGAFRRLSSLSKPPYRVRPNARHYRGSVRSVRGMGA